MDNETVDDNNDKNLSREVLPRQAAQIARALKKPRLGFLINKGKRMIIVHELLLRRTSLEASSSEITTARYCRLFIPLGRQLGAQISLRVPIRPGQRSLQSQ